MVKYSDVTQNYIRRQVSSFSIIIKQISILIWVVSPGVPHAIRKSSTLYGILKTAVDSTKMSLRF